MFSVVPVVPVVPGVPVVPAVPDVPRPLLPGPVLVGDVDVVVGVGGLVGLIGGGEYDGVDN